MKVEISNGELVDKYTILLIKKEKIKEENKNKNIIKEIEELEPLVVSLDLPLTLIEELYNTNKKLWTIEDDIRAKEDKNEFDEEFIELARSVYKTNGIRFKYKTEINRITASLFIEEKSH
jgi:hypothetical protein